MACTWPDRSPTGQTPWSAARAEAVVTGSGGTHRFQLGLVGDRLLVGDWDCDGEDGPALYRPSTGEAFVFERWTNGSPPDCAEHPPACANVDVLTDGHGCDRLVAGRSADGSQQSSRSRSS